MTAKPAPTAAAVNASGSGADTDNGKPRQAPLHVAIIMDGNGRWAAARGLKRAGGQREGVAAARRTVEAARDLNIGTVTLYSFSTENWRRPAGEVRDLMNLLRQFIGEDLPTLKREGVRVRIIGDKETLDRELRLLVSHAEKETSSNARFTLQIAFNYGGRNEIARAVRRLAADVAAGKLAPQDITEDSISRYLDTAALPDPADRPVPLLGEHTAEVLRECGLEDSEHEAITGAKN